jgi:hypothetical protein
VSEPLPPQGSEGHHESAASKEKQSQQLEDAKRALHVTRRRFLRILGINTALVTTVAISYAVRCDTKRRLQPDAAKGPRPKPDHFAEDAELEKFLSERFEIISGNAPADKAKVIGLGEFHFRIGKKGTVDQDAQKIGMQSMTQLATALERMAKPGDHVLLEGINPERGEMRPSFFLHPSLAFIDRRNGIMVSGWDNESVPKGATDEETRANGRKRNETRLFPTIVDRAARQEGRVFVTSGVAHFSDDRRIDDVLKNIPFILLGEKKAMEVARELGAIE